MKITNTTKATTKTPNTNTNNALSGEHAVISGLARFASAIADAIEKQKAAEEPLNALCAELHAMRVQFGKSVKSCPYRAALRDTLAGRGLKDQPLNNACTAAVYAVQAGRWLGSNPSRAKAALEPRNPRSAAQKLSVAFATVQGAEALPEFIKTVDPKSWATVLAAITAWKAANG